MEKNYVSIQELSLIIGVSTQSINGWYRWKRLHPEHELAQKLPDFTRIGVHRTRYWDVDIIPKIVEFRESIPQGRGGVMGEVTQKYVKKVNNNEQV